MKSLAAALLAVLALGAVASVEPARAAEPSFGAAEASAALGQPVTIMGVISGDDIESVELLVRLAGQPTAIVLPAGPVPPQGTWQATAEIDIASSALCACLADGLSAPNTRFEYQFRVLSADGATTLGPVGRGVVSDERFDWQTLEQDLVRVHWYRGDQAFAQSAAEVANQAIDRASELLGTRLDEPVDLYVYDTEEALRSAVSPNRENIAGQAHAAIGTMFVWIPGDMSADEFAGVLVAHELTHLVFDAATSNPYHGVPRWLDEGVAVYLSEGYSQDWRFVVDQAVRARSLIPLDGLASLFPSSADEFYLAYGESVAAIDFFIRTYEEETLWALVRSYAEGVSDDAAFTAATGADVAAFNRAWFESLGLEVPAPLGPQPGPPGPQPSDWQDGSGPVATAAPSDGAPAASTPPDAPATPSVAPTPSVGAPGGPGDAALSRALVVVGWLIVAAVLIALLGVFVVSISRGGRPRPF
jgi:hypothetical protein